MAGVGIEGGGGLRWKMEIFLVYFRYFKVCNLKILKSFLKLLNVKLLKNW